VYRFPVRPRLAELTIKGTLPSGEVYAALSPERPDFSFELRVSVLYRLRPGSLPALAETTRLRPEGLSDFYNAAEDQMAAAARTLVLGREAAASPDPVKSVTQGLSARFPHLELSMVSAYPVRLPDLALYERLRQGYQRITQAREASLKASAGRMAAAQAEENAAELRHERTLALLEKYGALLDRHPPLIKFLFLTKGVSPLDIQNLDLLGKLEALQ
jgi:hypothetical protein